MDLFIAIIFSGVFIAALLSRSDLFGRHKEHLAALSAQEGLLFQDWGDSAVVSGTVAGMPLEVTSELRGKYTKHPQIQLEGRLPLYDAPHGFSLSTEGLDSGFKRFADQKEIELGMVDFDNAFWVTADDPEALRDYLTEDRCHALLHWLYRTGSGRIENGVVKVSDTRLRLKGPVSPGLGVLIGLAKAFSGGDTNHQSTKDLETGWVLKGKMKSLGIGCVLASLVFTFLAVQVDLPVWALRVDVSLLLWSGLTAILALAGRHAGVAFAGAAAACSLGVATICFTSALVVLGLYLQALLLCCLAVAVLILLAGYGKFLGAMKR